MRLEQLQYFVQIVESHSFNKASERLHITQPALSKAIKALEEELETKLLIRTPQGVVATPWGMHIYEDSKALIHQLQEKIALWKQKSSSSCIPAIVSIVGIPSACCCITERFLPLFKEQFPGLEIVLYEKNVYELLDVLKNGTVNIALTSYTLAEEEHAIRQCRSIGFRAIPLLDDDYRIFISAKHPLSSRSIMRASDCAELSFATYSNQFGRERSLFSEISTQLGVRKCMYVSSRENIMQMVTQNKAVGCFLHRMASCSWYVTNGLIKILPVGGISLLPSRHFLLTREKSHLSSEENSIVEYFCCHYKSIMNA